MISNENRLFIEKSGEMVNTSDGQRNVAFRVSTFLTLLNSFYAVLYSEYAEKGTELFEKAIYTAGLSCGKNFGNDIAKIWKKDGTFGTNDDNIDRWCKFDSDIGFGLLDYNKKNNILKVTNLFVLASGGVQDNLKFFNGYVTGVLCALTGMEDLELPDPDRMIRQGIAVVEYKIDGLKKLKYE